MAPSRKRSNSLLGKLIPQPAQPASCRPFGNRSGNRHLGPLTPDSSLNSGKRTATDCKHLFIQSSRDILPACEMISPSKGESEGKLS